MLKADDIHRTIQTAAPGAGAGAVSAVAPSEAGDKRDWSGPHPVDIRLTIPVFFGRVYVTLLAGRERRSTERLRAERRRHSLLKTGNTVLFLFLGTVVGLALLSIFQLLSQWILT